MDRDLLRPLIDRSAPHLVDSDSEVEEPSRFVWSPGDVAGYAPFAELATQAIAGEVVRLQGTSFQHLMNLSAEQRADLEAMVAREVEGIVSAWEHAAQEAGAHVQVVAQNNPMMSMDEVLAREDVQDALSVPFQEAADRTEEGIRRIWDDAGELGVRHAAEDLSVAGISPGEIGPLDESILDRVISDAHRNAAQARDRLLGRFTPTEAGRALTADQAQQWQQSTDREAADLGRRGRMSLEAAAGSAHSQAQAASYQAAGEAAGVEVRWVWVTSFSVNTCLTCAQLHGTVRGSGQAFPALATPGIHPLGYPPRHPNCRCRLVPWVGDFEDEGGPTPDTMSSWAADWIVKMLKGLIK